MLLNNGDTLGHYEIVAAIGAGGMGEVYKARDTRLNRIVAVKVLPSHIAQRADLRARFEREARAVSSLNHPNICTLFDVGHKNGVDFMVLEHLDGETLFERLRRGPLPLEQALKYAAQIADALDRAHRSGVVHRDLKPGNIMLTRDGAKVLDFGLAKTAFKGAPDAVTLTQAITGEGALMGTLQYMAPEQIEGKEADARTDVFAFGCVLYEMVAAKRAFEGTTKATVIGAILSSNPPPMSALQPVTPRGLERLVMRCLAKDPEDRYQSLRDVFLDLHGEPSKPVLPQPKAGRRWLWLSLVAAVAALAGVAGWMAKPLPPAPRHTLSLSLPPDHHYQSMIGEEGGSAISPDGTMFAFIAYGKSGTQQIWLRRMDSGQMRPIPGTERARHPFWSPDSRFLGFFGDGKLRKVAADGGPPQTLCDVPNERGAAWGRDGSILIGSMGSGILRVSAAGGSPALVTDPRNSSGDSHIWPSFLPGGEGFLYTNLSGLAERRGVYAVKFAEPSSPKRLLALITNAAYSPLMDSAGSLSSTGFLLFYREGALMAQRFNRAQWTLLDEPVPIADRVSFSPAGFSADFSFSVNGTLIYSSGASTEYQLTWRDTSGRKLGTVGEPGIVNFPALSRGGKRLAFRRVDPNGNYDVWIEDLGRATATRFTFGAAISSFPTWSPNDEWLAFSSNSGGRFRISRKRAAGGGETEVIAEGIYVTDWSIDGRFLLVSGTGPNGFDVQVLPLTGERKLGSLLNSRFNETFPRLSPDGKWVAYTSDETGVREVFTRRFNPHQPVQGEGWQVSRSGGVEPRWRGDTREIYYLSPDGKLMTAAVHLEGDRFVPGTPRALFETKAESSSNIIWDYDVTRDGQRFIIAEPLRADSQPLTVVLNWQAGLKR